MKMFTIREISEILHLDIQIVYKKIKRGEIKASRIGKTYRISEEEVNRIYEGDNGKKQGD